MTCNYRDVKLARVWKSDAGVIAPWFRVSIAFSTQTVPVSRPQRVGALLVGRSFGVLVAGRLSDCVSCSFEGEAPTGCMSPVI